jgi:UTP--glucose-1-phosphate uridylyltransferase
LEAALSKAAIRTVIIPAAGRGTRLLPATKVTPKELLPVYDRLVLDFAIDEAVSLGADRIIIVISTAKLSIQTYLDDRKLRGCAGKFASPAALQRVGPEIIYVFQDIPRGLGHAVLCCKDVMLPGPFAVLLPDDMIAGPNCLVEMAARYSAGHMVAAMQVKPEHASQYGIFRLSGPPDGDCVPVSGMVEKPSDCEMPSSLAAVGRYVLDPMIFDVLDRTPNGRGGELQLTDAINISARATQVLAFKFRGTRHDCGNHDGLLGASLARQAAVRAKLVSSGSLGAQSDTPSAPIHAIVSG